MILDDKFAYMATGRPYNDLDPLLEDARDESTNKTNQLNRETNRARKEKLVVPL